MSTAIIEIEAKVRALNTADKADLLRTLIAELDSPADADVEAAWLREAQRRHREIVEGKVQPVPGDQIFKDLRARRCAAHTHHSPTAAGTASNAKVSV